MLNLKSFTAVLLCAVTFGAVAQTRTDTVEYRPPYSDLLPIKCIRTVPYKTFDGERKVDGTLTIEGKGGWDAGQHNDNQQYSESRTYVRGMLNGHYRQSYRHNGSGVAGGRYKINRGWTAEGDFRDGLPVGIWSFSLDSKYNSPDDHSNTLLKERVTFVDGLAVSITDQDGNSITIDSKGLFDGKGNIKGGDHVTLKKSIITNLYTDATGETRPTSTKERQLIDRIISGEESLFTLADKGYTIDYQEVFLAQWARFAEHCDRYAQMGSFATRFRVPKYSARIGRLTEINTVSDEKAVEYYHQRNKEYDNLKTQAHYNTRYGKRYLSSNAEREIDRCWRIDQERMLSHTLATLSQMQHNKDLTGCSSEEGSIYELIDFNDIKTSSDERCKAVLSLLDATIGSLYPIAGCKIESIDWHPYQGYIAQCRINQTRRDSIGYNSYRAQLEVDYNGHLMIELMKGQSYPKVSNIWDTVDAREATLSRQHSALLSKCGGIKTWRDDYIIAYENMLSDRTTKAEVRLKDLAAMDSLQRQFESNIDLFAAIDAGDREAHKYFNFRTLTALYDAMMKEADIEWSDDTSHLKKVTALQRQYLDILKTNPPAELERTANMERIRTAKELIELVNDNQF